MYSHYTTRRKKREDFFEFFSKITIQKQKILP